MSDAPPPLDDDALSGRKFVRWNLGALLAGCAALAAGVLLHDRTRAAAGGPETAPEALLALPDWSDGTAEVARYAARRTVDGVEREVELVRTTVVEPGALEAVRTTALQRTGEGQASVVVRVARADPARLLDASLAAQEGGGNRLLLVRGALPERPWRRVGHATFAGDLEDELPPGTVLEDQLPLLVRALDLSGGPREVQLLPSLLGGQAPAARPVPARIERRAAGVEVQVPFGRLAADEVAVEGGGVTRRYWVGRAGLRPLLRWEDSTGAGALTGLERSAPRR